MIDTGEKGQNELAGFYEKALSDELGGFGLSPARAVGFYAFMALGMAPLGALQIGWLSEVLGVRAAMAIGGVMCSIGAAVLWDHRRRSRRRHPGDESV